MIGVDPSALDVNDVVTVQDTFKVTAVTEDLVFAGEVAYRKVPPAGITRHWDLAPVPGDAA